MEITTQDIKEGALVFGGLIAFILLFGKLVDSQRDTNKDWEEYIEGKQRHHEERPR